jgi:transposase
VFRPRRSSPLPPDVRRQVLDRFNNAVDPETRTRYQMILLATDRHLTSAEIAALVFRSHDTVERVLHRFENEGLDAVPRRHGGGPAPVLTRDAEDELVRVIEDDPHAHGFASANWTTSLLATHLAQSLGISVSLETVRVALHRRGYVCKRPTWTVQHKAQEREDWVGNAFGSRSS